MLETERESIYLQVQPELVPTAGTGKVQSSLDGTTWEDWTAGVVAAATREDVSPIVRYIRQVNATGTTKLNLGVV